MSVSCLRTLNIPCDILGHRVKDASVSPKWYSLANIATQALLVCACVRARVCMCARNRFCS